MPYYISTKQTDCADWATVKQETDGTYTTIGCHKNKQDAIDQMIAISLEEDIEPQGEVRAVNLAPPAYMRAAARRGLRLHEEGKSGDGLVPQTVEDARKMAAGTVTEEKWRKIAPWIARHLVDIDAIQGDEITAGLVAHLLWGSDGTKQGARRTMEHAQSVTDQLNNEQRAPAPAKDKIFGSDKNPSGSAEGKENEIKLSEATEASLETKAKDHNERMRSENKPDWTSVRVGSLRAVWRRGAGAFSTSHRPNMSRAGWAMARVNAFLYLSEKGKPQNPNYITDNDLLNSKHPKFSDNKKEEKMYDNMTDEEDNQMHERGALPPSYRLATSDDIPVEGAMCSACCHYENREEPYCHKWDATVAADYYCDAFMPMAMEAEVSMEEEMPDEMNHWVVAEKEDRSIVYSNLEVRASADGKTLTGYAAVFDSPSEPLPWTEYVRRGAFTKTINDGADVRLLIDHEGIPLARTKSGTLTLEEDDYGLRIAAELDDANPDAARVISALRRGDLSQMSFAFQTVKDSWNSDRSTRELKEVRLHDVSVVTYPAYEETLAEVRTRNSTSSVILPTVLPITLRKRQIEIMRQQAVD